MSAQPVETPPVVTRQALRYYGSKVSLAAWIISHFPPHAHYVEPYAGGCAVLLSKPPSRLETVNDLDGDVVTFFRVLRDRAADLIRAIELTPFARAEYEAARTPAADDVERARRLYVRSWQGRGNPTSAWVSGWRRAKDPFGARGVDSWQTIDHLYAVARRLRQVQIESDDALNVIRRYDRPDALFYCDPPYLAETRGRWAANGYQHEMTEADHRALAEVLHAAQGMVVLSGYSSDLYADLYAGWRTETREAKTDGGFTRTEVLWLNPAAARGGRQPRLLEVLS